MLDVMDFINQKTVQEAFITGAGGTGKTELLIKVVNTLNENRIPYIVLAFTNKAVSVLRARLPEGSPIKTLHSFLQKRPTINSKAETVKSMFTTMQFGKPETVKVVIVDEFSMVGEKDYMDLGECIDPESTGDMQMHCIYSGDLNQLPPVGSICPIIPKGKYWVNLTKVWRTTSDLTVALDFIRDRQAKNIDITADSLPECSALYRDVPILSHYKDNEEPNKVILAWTNASVQAMNASIQGRESPEVGDIIYDSTLKEVLTITSIIPVAMLKFNTFITHRKDETIDSNTKYNPLATISKIDILSSYEVTDVDGNEFSILAVFGSKNYNDLSKKLAEELAIANTSKNETLAKKAYAMLKSFKDYVHQVDFNHCITVHKSQGSQYNDVYINWMDLANNPNTSDKLKLIYTAMSRAKKRVFINE